MTEAALHQETYIADDTTGAAQVYDFLAAHETKGKGRPARRYLLAGADAGDQVEIPFEVYRVLRQVVEAMGNGLAVTVVPQTKTLTTQQAADLLGISRPTLVKLVDAGEIPHERHGTRRKVRLQDVLAYRERRRAEQYAALEATSVDLDDEDDLETSLDDLKDARRAIARRRRGTDS